MQKITHEFVSELLPKRPCDGHKGTFGHLFIIAGSPGFTGAPKLAAEGALRSGVGLVTLGLSSTLVPLVTPSLLETMWFSLDVTPEGAFASNAVDAALDFAADKQAVVLGPGMSQREDVCSFVMRFVRNCRVPLLIDADGLNCISRSPEVLQGLSICPCLTPHPGEMARLVGVSTGVVQKDRPGVASRFAIDFGCVVVLKGHETVVATPEGEVFKNPTGNSGMATGGTGDVLSGLIGGLMAQGLNSTYAAVVGTYLHGLAGDIAAETKTERGLIARDVIEAIPQAWGRLENTLKTSEGN